MRKLVEYDENAVEDAAVLRLCKLGFEETDAKWLGHFMEHPDFFNYTFELGTELQERQKNASIDICINTLKPIFDGDETDRDTLMVRVVQVLLGFDQQFWNGEASNTGPWDGYDGASFFVELLKLKETWKTELRDLSINWNAGLQNAAAHGVKIYHKFAAALCVLEPDNFRWTSILNENLLVKDHSIDEALMNLSGDHEAQERIFNDPTRLEFWLAVFWNIDPLPYAKELNFLQSFLAKKEDLQQEKSVNGVLWSCHAFNDWAQSNEAGPFSRPAVIHKVLKEIEINNANRSFNALSCDTAQYSWMTLCNRIENVSPDYTTPYRRKHMLNVAHKALGKVRNAMREEDPITSKLEYRRIQFPAAVDIVNKLGAPWRATKATLLALRELQFPSVGADLRYWSEHGKEPPPELWWEIPSLIAEQLRLHKRSAPQDDRLEDIRDKFARFCLERLKTTKTDGENKPVESIPIWREVYCRALRELRSNPGGRGHHVLHWVSQEKNEPDKDVRRAASSAYKVLRKNEGLPARTSPLTAMFAAFWWLRQAHVIALGGDVDQPGASRTRSKEVRRTT